MADRKRKVPENVDGAYYVDEECIACHLCHEICSKCFAVSEDEECDYVSKLPSTEAEVSLCREAMESCPVEAIGDDGI